MSHEHHGRPCHLNGCTRGETVPVECPACEQQVGRAPVGGMAQASVTWEKLRTHRCAPQTSDEYRTDQAHGVARHGLRPTSQAETNGGVTMAESVSAITVDCPRCQDQISVGVFVSGVVRVNDSVQVTLAAEDIQHTCADLGRE